MSQPDDDAGTADAENTVLKARDLRVRYGRTEVFTGLNLTVRAGEAVALLGRNGVGKSSLVRCLLGQQRPSGGTVRLFGADVWRHRARLMTRVGVVPEDGDAPPSMNARQLSSFCRALYPAWDQPGFNRRLERFEISAKTAFGELSRGQKTQVMLALALAPSPEFLLLDDPTLGLDAVARRAVFEELVGELADRGTTVLLTSHDLPGIESLATRIAALAGGRLVLDEPLEDLKARHRWLTVGVDAGDLGGDLEALEPIDEMSLGAHQRSVLVSRWREGWRPVRRAEGEEIPMARLDPRPASLEEILVASTAGEREPEDARR
ncbi:MAG: ABC transporter ATP-binding protein [Acidobacteriota bacterium]